MQTLQERRANSIAFVPREPISQVEITPQTRSKYDVMIGLAELRVGYNSDNTVTFFRRNLRDDFNGQVRYHPVDLTYGIPLEREGDTFAKPMPADLISLLREESEKLAKELSIDPTPDKFVTAKIQKAYRAGRGSGRIGLHVLEEGPVFSVLRSGNDRPAEYARVDVLRGIIQGTDSYPQDLPLSQGWWELYRSKINTLRPASIPLAA